MEASRENIKGGGSQSWNFLGRIGEATQEELRMAIPFLSRPSFLLLSFSFPSSLFACHSSYSLPLFFILFFFSLFDHALRLSSFVLDSPLPFLSPSLFYHSLLLPPLFFITPHHLFSLRPQTPEATPFPQHFFFDFFSF